MMKLIAITFFALCSIVAQAQSTPAKKELVAKLLTLQQKAIEQSAQALVERPALMMMQQASIALQTRVAPDKREAIAKQIQEDLNKYAAEVGPMAREQAVKLAPSTIGALLEEKFTEAELQELIGIIESPVNRKFMQMGGDFQKALGEKLVAQMKPSVDARIKTLEQSVVKHLGLPSAPAAKASAPLLGAPQK